MSIPHESYFVAVCDGNDTVTKFDDGVFCNSTFDGYLCWRRSLPGSVLKQRCPALKGFDTRFFASRRCREDGWWEGGTSPEGLTNYSECLTPELRKMLGVEDLETKVKIAGITRILELVGFSASFVFLIISLFVFFYFRGLKTHKTHIHKNLFAAMLIQVTVRLIVYIDQAIVRTYSNVQGIDNTAGVCESFYVFLEYGRTAMFMWFLVEGLYLNQLVAISVFAFHPNYYLYYCLGWGLPLTTTAIWASVTAKYMRHTQCWSLYSFKPYFWIIEGPRFLALFINLVVLLNTLRILLTTVKEASATKPEKIVKALKAGLVLIPLLGISNVLQMIEAPLHRSSAEFAVWAFTSHFLSSFQGVLISFVYCFFNKEVRNIMQKRWRCHRAKSFSRNNFGASVKYRAGSVVRRDSKVDKSGRSSRKNRLLSRGYANDFTSSIRMTSFKKCVGNEEESSPTNV
ncbi:pdfr-1 (predicted) [Pycnogonum litorale]